MGETPHAKEQAPDYTKCTLSDCKEIFVDEEQAASDSGKGPDTIPGIIVHQLLLTAVHLPYLHAWVLP